MRIWFIWSVIFNPFSQYFCEIICHDKDFNNFFGASRRKNCPVKRLKNAAAGSITLRSVIRYKRYDKIVNAVLMWQRDWRTN